MTVPLSLPSVSFTGHGLMGDLGLLVVTGRHSRSPLSRTPLLSVTHGTGWATTIGGRQ